MSSGDVRIRITGSDETAAAFRSAEAAAHRLERGLSFLTKFSLGAGAGVGIAALVSHINHLAEKLSDTNPEAKKFADEMDRIRAVVDSGFLAAFSAINPILDAIATGAEAAAGNFKSLREEFLAYEGARDKVRNADPLYYKNTQEYKDAMARHAPTDPSISNSGKIVRIGDTYNQLKAISQAEAAYEALLRVQADAEANQKILAQRVELAQLSAQGFQQSIDSENADLEEQAAKEKRLQQLSDQGFQDSIQAESFAVKKLEDESAANQKKMQQQSQQFGAFFADAIVGAATGSFKEVLVQWAIMLAQMELQQEAADLFKSAGGWSGIASGAASLFGFASGGSFDVGGKSGTDANVVAFRATRGERVTVTRDGMGGGGAVVQNINVDARNSTDPVATAAAVRIAVAQANQARASDRRRGR